MDGAGDGLEVGRPTGRPQLLRSQAKYRPPRSDSVVLAGPIVDEPLARGEVFDVAVVLHTHQLCWPCDIEVARAAREHQLVIDDRIGDSELAARGHDERLPLVAGQRDSAVQGRSHSDETFRAREREVTQRIGALQNLAERGFSPSDGLDHEFAGRVVGHVGRGEGQRSRDLGRSYSLNRREVRRWENRRRVNQATVEIALRAMHEQLRAARRGRQISEREC